MRRALPFMCCDANLDQRRLALIDYQKLMIGWLREYANRPLIDRVEPAVVPVAHKTRWTNRCVGWVQRVPVPPRLLTISITRRHCSMGSAPTARWPLMKNVGVARTMSDAAISLFCWTFRAGRSFS